MMDYRIRSESDREIFIKDIEDLKLPFKAKVDRVYDKGTSNQGRYYWGVIIKMVADMLGMFPEDTHHMLLEKFAKVGEATDEKGRDLVITESTTGMNVARRERYYDDIKKWMIVDFNLYIPEPGEIFDEDEIVLKFINK
jgi:hypothetical protein